MQCSGKAMSLDSHEIGRISKDQLPGIVTPMFLLFFFVDHVYGKLNIERDN